MASQADGPAPNRSKRGRQTSSDNSSPEPRDEVKRSSNKTVDVHLGNCPPPPLLGPGLINSSVDRIEARIKELIRQNEQQNKAVASRRKGHGKRRQRHESEVGAPHKGGKR